MSFWLVVYAVLLIITFIAAVLKGMEADEAAETQEWSVYHKINGQFMRTSTVFVVELFLGVVILASGE